MLTRRRFLSARAAVAAGGAAVGVGSSARRAASARQRPAGRAGRPARRPAERQHAWDATLRTDADGNPIAPRFDRLLFFDVAARPRRRTRACSRRRCARSSTLPVGPGRACCSPPAGGPAYFERVLGVALADPVAKGAVGLRAAGDRRLPPVPAPRLRRRERLADVEAALVHGAPLAGADGPLELSSALRWRETRTGFVGAGLPAAHQDVGGIPPGNPVATSAPLFMGFKSSLRTNQATEDDVTIPDGPVRRRHDDAGQLHAPAARQLVPGSERARAGRAHVRAPGHPRAGRRASPPTPKATPTSSARRSTATA